MTIYTYGNYVTLEKENFDSLIWDKISENNKMPSVGAYEDEFENIDEEELNYDQFQTYFAEELSKMTQTELLHKLDTDYIYIEMEEAK